MNAVSYRVTTQARRQIGALLALVLLIGVAGGVTLAAAGAARRTDTAFDRMVESTDAWDVVVNPNEGTESALTVVPHDLGPSGLGRPVVHDGRLPDRDAADELFVQRYWADENGIEVGDRISVGTPDLELAAQVLTDEEPSAEGVARLIASAKPLELTVVGIGDDPQSIAYDEGFEPLPWTMTPAFYEQAGEPSLGFWAAPVKLRDGFDVESLRTAVAQLAEDFPLVPANAPAEQQAPEDFALQGLDGLRDKAERAIEPQVVALWAFAIVAGLVGSLVVAQAVARRIASDANDNPALDAMGFSRRQRTTSDLIRAGVVGMAGGAVAVVLAAAVSGFAPIGPARFAETDPGVMLDGLVLGLGALLIPVLVLMFAVFPAWWAARIRHDDERVRASRAAGWLGDAGAGLTSVLGARFAFEPGPRNRAVPTRSTIIGACTAVVVAAAALTFGASLDHLVETPRLYGSPWDYLIDTDSEGGPEVAVAVDERIDESPEVASWARIDVDEVVIGGRTIASVAFGGPDGHITPVILAGRAPEAEDEVALGAKTMHSLGVGVGDEVTVDDEGDTLRVVGRTVLPGVGTYQAAEKTSLGEGALLSEAGLDRFGHGFDQTNRVLKAAPGVSADQVQALFADDGTVYVKPVSKPSDVAALQSLRSTPTILATLLVVLLALTVAHAMLLAVRRRRRDVAILQTIGFRPGQVIRTTLWQATIIAGLGIVVGIPVGYAVGRWAWMVLADRLGTVGEAALPALALAATAAAVLVLANLVGLVPGLRSAHSTPSSVLRSE